MKKSFPLLLAIILFSCGPGKQEKAVNKADQFLVTAVNYPLYYFAGKIGAGLVQVAFPAPGDVDPAYWIPDDEALSLYQSSDLILANGADYAKWMNNVSLPASRIINTSSRARDRYIEITEGSSHSHGPEGEHVHTGFAFTTWLNFQIAITQAESVKEALINNLPDQRDIVEEHYLALEKELQALHSAMIELSGEIREEQLLGSHPVYQYLSDAYNLNIRSLHFEPGEMPSEGQWQELDILIKEHPSVIMLWEDEPLPEVKEILLEKGIITVVFNPCGNRPGKGDFMDVMRNNIQALQGAN